MANRLRLSTIRSIISAMCRIVRRGSADSPSETVRVYCTERCPGASFIGEPASALVADEAGEWVASISNAPLPVGRETGILLHAPYNNPFHLATALVSSICMRNAQCSQLAWVGLTTTGLSFVDTREATSEEAGSRCQYLVAYQSCAASKYIPYSLIGRRIYIWVPGLPDHS